jgi:hypothetical protein
LYNRAGDDPCPSGTSMMSSDAKDSILSSEKAQLQVPPTTAIVHDLAQDVEFVWYAAYDLEMSTTSFCSLLEGCRNKSMPLKTTSIKMDNYDIVFSDTDNAQGVVFLQQKIGAYCYVKLYLIHKDQLFELSQNKSNCFAPEYSDFSMLNDQIVNSNSSVVINHSLPYGYLLRITEFQGYPIYALTNSRLYKAQETKNICSPSEFYITEYYKALLESIENFSPAYLMYYITSKRGWKMAPELKAKLKKIGNFVDSNSHRQYQTN